MAVWRFNEPEPFSPEHVLFASAMEESMWAWLRRYVVPRDEFDSLAQSHAELKGAVDKLTVELALQVLQTPPAKAPRTYKKPPKLRHKKVCDNIIVADFTSSR